MDREIDLLLGATGRGVLPVEKDSNVLWSEDDLLAARAAGLFEDGDRITPPGTQAVSVSGVFPGCMHQGGASAEFSRYVLIGQTEHFFLFAQPGA